jgi:hypothetical protein
MRNNGKQKHRNMTPKFKRGDRVKNLVEDGTIKRGATGTVDDDGSCTPWVIWDSHEMLYFVIGVGMRRYQAESALELIEADDKSLALTKKHRTMKKIEQVKAGKAAIENTGTVDELNKVLKYCWPDDLESAGVGRYYYDDEGWWRSYNRNPLATSYTVQELLAEIEGGVGLPVQELTLPTLTKREYFALQGLLSIYDTIDIVPNKSNVEYMAKLAVSAADALIAELEKYSVNANSNAR